MISQRKDETLWDYVERFNAEMLNIEICNGDVAMVAFTWVLNKRNNKEFAKSLYLNPHEDFDTTFSRAMESMQDDEAQDTSEDEDQMPPYKQNKWSKGERTTNKNLKGPNALSLRPQDISPH